MFVFTGTVRAVLSFLLLREPARELAFVLPLKNTFSPSTFFRRFGYYHYASGGERNVTLAAEWFEASGLPEGALVRAMHRRSLGDYEAADWWEGVARAKGYGTPWRITAWDMTGSGGAGGVNLNCQWPPTSEGLTPPRW